MAKKYYSPKSHECEFYEVDNIDHHLTLENCLVKFTYTFRKFLFLLHFTIPLVGPGSHPRGKPRTCALLYSSTRMFLANSGAVAQEKSKTRKQESPAHIYQSEIEGKAVLK